MRVPFSVSVVATIREPESPLDDGEDEGLIEVNREYPKGTQSGRHESFKGEEEDLVRHTALAMCLWQKERAGFQSNIDVRLSVRWMGESQHPLMNCPICLEPCKEAGYVCGHPIHADCWLKDVLSCPFCRNQVKIENVTRLHLTSLVVPETPWQISFEMNKSRAQRWLDEAVWSWEVLNEGSDDETDDDEEEVEETSS